MRRTILPENFISMTGIVYIHFYLFFAVHIKIHCARLCYVDFVSLHIIVIVAALRLA